MRIPYDTRPISKPPFPGAPKADTPQKFPFPVRFCKIPISRCFPKPRFRFLFPFPVAMLYLVVIKQYVK